MEERGAGCKCGCRCCTVGQGAEIGHGKETREKMVKGKRSREDEEEVVEGEVRGD